MNRWLRKFIKFYFVAKSASTLTKRFYISILIDKIFENFLLAAIDFITVIDLYAGYLPTFGPSFINMYGAPREFSALHQQYTNLNEGKVALMNVMVLVRLKKNSIRKHVLPQ